MSGDSLSQAVTSFLEHLANERQLSHHTIDAYRRDIVSVVNYLKEQDLEDWQQVHSHHLRSYLVQENRTGRAGKTLQRKLSAVRTFFNYLAREGQVRTNPAMEFSAPRGDARLPETIDTDQVARLLDMDSSGWHGQRDRAMLELFYSSGLRLGELVGSNLNDISFDDNTIRVLGKGNKERVLPIGSHALKAIRQWLDIRDDLPRGQLTDSQALFLSERGSRISPRVSPGQGESLVPATRHQCPGSSTHAETFFCQPPA